MKMILIGLVFTLAGETSLAAEQNGVVYLGCNHSKGIHEHSARIRVNELLPVSFDKPYNGVRLIASGLDTNISHRVRIYFDGKVVMSWKFSFSRLKTTEVGIWRSAGYWHTDPMPLSRCDE